MCLQIFLPACGLSSDSPDSSFQTALCFDGQWSAMFKHSPVLKDLTKFSPGFALAQAIDHSILTLSFLICEIE